MSTEFLKDPNPSSASIRRLKQENLILRKVLKTAKAYFDLTGVDSLEKCEDITKAVYEALKEADNAVNEEW